MRLITSMLLLAGLALAQTGRPWRTVWFTPAGSANAITGKPSPVLPSYGEMLKEPRMLACFIVGTSNTAGVTLALSNLSAIPVYKTAGSITTALAANDLRLGAYACVVYVAAGNFQLVTQPGNAASSSITGGTCSINQVMNSLNTSGVPSCLQLNYNQLAGTPPAPAALAADGANCSGSLPRGVDASGAAQGCADVDLTTEVTGVLPAGGGGTGQATPTDATALIGNGTGWDKKTLPSCSNTTTSKLLFNNSTKEFSCGTDQTGAGGGTVLLAGNCVVQLTSGQTGYCGHSGFDLTEAGVKLVIPMTGTLQKFRFVNVNYANASLACTVRIGAVDTAITATMASDSAIGTLTADLAHTVAVTEGDLFTMKCLNGSGFVSANINWQAQVQ